MRANIRIVTTALVGVLVICGVSGCSIVYPFELRGVIRNSADGTPLAGVTVMLKAPGIIESHFPVVTEADGSFVATFKVFDTQFDHGKLPQWSLDLSKDGYEEETLDVSPKQAPESSKKTTQISVEGSLRVK
jgi:hypothetical protein